MLKLVSGHRHQHSPTGIGEQPLCSARAQARRAKHALGNITSIECPCWIPATKTPSREMEAPLRSFEDMEASPKADAQQVL